MTAGYFKPLQLYSRIPAKNIVEWLRRRYDRYLVPAVRTVRRSKPSWRIYFESQQVVNKYIDCFPKVRHMMFFWGESQNRERLWSFQLWWLKTEVKYLTLFTYSTFVSSWSASFGNGDMFSLFKTKLYFADQYIVMYNRFSIKQVFCSDIERKTLHCCFIKPPITEQSHNHSMRHNFFYFYCSNSIVSVYGPITNAKNQSPLVPYFFISIVPIRCYIILHTSCSGHAGRLVRFNAIFC